MICLFLNENNNIENNNCEEFVIDAATAAIYQYPKELEN